jgi:hypothetical protein
MGRDFGRLTEIQPLPKVTPSLLHRADTMCARRLAREYEGGHRSHDPFHRGRLRDAFLAAAREVHAELRVPTAHDFADLGSTLFPESLPEERAVLAQAAQWYVRIFGDRPARWDDPGTDQPTERRGVRVGGWVDLPLRVADGSAELRQLELWGRRVPPDDPLDLPALRVAFLRLTPWLDGAPLRIVWVDLLRGLVRDRVVSPDERTSATEWFDERVAVVEARARDATTTPGADCGGCGIVSACPEHPKGAHYGRRGDLLPGIVHITPTSIEAWRRCRREWRNRYLFNIPPSDTDPSPVHGQLVHDLLRFVHEEGTCADDTHVDDVLLRHGLDGDGRIRGEIARHTARCPTPAEALGHEVTRARFAPHPTTPFMATARIDALWLHDGVLDARDYKTGRAWSDRVADDAQARLQAWVLAPLAAQLGARLRVGFEQLAAEVLDDPEPFEPDGEDLDAIELELRSEVEAMRIEAASSAPFAGIGDPEVCGRCRYRSICPDSAAESVPVWPVVENEESAEPSLS